MFGSRVSARNPKIHCRQYQKSIFVGEVITLNGDGLQNELFNVTYDENLINEDQIDIDIIELMTGNWVGTRKTASISQLTAATPSIPIQLRCYWMVASLLLRPRR